MTSTRPTVKTDEELSQVIEVFEYQAGTSRYTGHRIFCVPNPHTKIVGEAFGQVLKL